MPSAAPSTDVSAVARTPARIGLVAGGGVGLAVLFFATRGLADEGNPWWLAALEGGFIALIFGGIVGYWTLRYGAIPYVLIWRPVARLGRRGRLVVAAIGCAGIALLLATAWTTILKLAVHALPAAFVLLFGGWASVLLDRRIRAARRVTAPATARRVTARRAVARRAVVRRLPDALAIATFAGSLIVLFDRDLLTTQPAAGALFPVGAWLSVRIWRAMLGSRRLAVRAGADIAFSLLLGTDLVLIIVWAANLFRLAPAEVTTLRAVLEHTGGATELPWQFWLALYLALVAGTVLFTVLGARLGARWARLTSGIRSVDVGRRLLTGVHIGLMVTVLIAMTTPAALAGSLPLRARYRVDLQRELTAAGAVAAYDQIRRHFTAATAPVQRPAALAAIVLKIHRISPPPSGSRDATATERHLARYVGQLEADAAAFGARLPARLDLPAPTGGGLRDRVDRLEDQQRRAAERTAQAQRLGELAAVVIAGTLQIPDIGRNEVIQIVREYLSGLVEGGRLRDVFAAWARHIPVADRLSPEKVVIPDLFRLQLAAGRALVQRLLSLRGRPFVPSTTRRPPDEPPADRAVDLANQVRYFDEGTGPCSGCAHPVRPGEEPHIPGERRPIEPRPRIP